MAWRILSVDSSGHTVMSDGMDKMAAIERAHDLIADGIGVVRIIGPLQKKTALVELTEGRYRDWARVSERPAF